MFILLTSCRDDNTNISLRPVKSDTTLPKYDHDILEALPETTSKLNLTQIKNGVDSFEFRFWLPSKDIQTINVLSIKYVGNKWVSTITSFLPTLPDHDFKRNDTTNYFSQTTISNLTTKDVTSNIDIEAIVKRLSEFDLQNSPNNKELENGQSVSSSDIRYILEFADKYNYRAIHYLKSSRYPNEILIDKKFVEFLEFIKTKFHLKNLLAVKNTAYNMGFCVSWG